MSGLAGSFGILVPLGLVTHRAPRSPPSTGALA